MSPRKPSVHDTDAQDAIQEPETRQGSNLELRRRTADEQAGRR
jgi:hypothetical protein